MPIALMGRQVPRLELVPDLTSTAAVETIELAATVGLKLDPWQQRILNGGLGEDQSGQWVAFLVGVIVQRQNGKGGITDPLELACIYLFGDPKVIHSAHRVDTATGAYYRVKDLIDSSDDLSRRVKRMIDSAGEALIELTTGQRLEFRTRNQSGGRGLTAGKLFLDEALELQLEQMAALLPTLLAIPNAQVWVTSTVPKFDGQYLTQLRKRVLAGVAERTAYYEWGVDKGARLDDPQALAEANPALGFRISLERLQDMRRELGDELFARECMGIWPEASDAEWLVIPADSWMTHEVLPDSQIVGRPALGVYVNPDRSYAAIVAAGDRAAGGRQVEITVNSAGVVDFRPGTGWIVPRLKELEVHQPCVVVVDDRAVAEAAEAENLVVHRSSLGDVVTGCQLLFDGVAGADQDTADVHHLGQPDLTAAAAGAVRRNVGGSWAWDRRAATVEIAPIAAASLALFGHSTPRVHREPAQPFFGSWR